jgi:hypothetical protein
MSDSSLFFDAHKAFYDHLKTWTTLPILLSNDSGVGVNIANGFVVLDVRLIESEFATINANRPKIRTNGVASIEIYTQQNTGAGLGMTYAGEIAALFRGKRLLSNQIICYAPNLISVGFTKYVNKTTEYVTGKYHLELLNCPFIYDRYTDSLT